MPPQDRVYWDSSSEHGMYSDTACAFCGFITRLICREGIIMCRDKERCNRNERNRTGKIMRPEASGWVDDGVIREDEVYDHPEDYAEWIAERLGMTVEEYNENERKRREIWANESAAIREEIERQDRRRRRPRRLY